MLRILRVIFLSAVMMLVTQVTLQYTAQQSGATLTHASSIKQSSGQAAHYIVFEKQANGTITPRYYRQVQLATSLKSLSDEQLTRNLAQPNRNSEQMVVLLQSASGQTIFQNIIEVPRWLRGEFHGSTADEPIDGHWFPLERSAFVVRLPILSEGTSILLQNRERATESIFNISDIIQNAEPISLDGTSLHSIQSSGDPANRVDFLIMGDGYTAAQENKFISDANMMADQFFSISPYAEYKNYINIHTLFVPSAQSGADHPPYDANCTPGDPTCCGDTEMLTDTLAGITVTTAFESRYCHNNIHRLLVASDTLVLNEAAAAPDFDQILLLVNDETYGGSGGQFPISSMEPRGVQIAQHEYGHSFVGLADEYTDTYPGGYPPCSDVTGNSPCEANVTDVTVREDIKWKPWIDDNTPIPTDEDPSYADVVGLFEGARYTSTGMYRSGYDCIMRTLGQPYCQVPTQAYILKLYEGWTTPGISETRSGISLIEPGTTLPASNSITLTHPSTQVFKADILQPITGSVQIAWRIDGITVPQASGETFTYTTSPNTQAPVKIELVVKDMTPWVHPAMAGDSLQSVYTWTVEVLAPTAVTDSNISVSENSRLPMLAFLLLGSLLLATHLRRDRKTR